MFISISVDIESHGARDCQEIRDMGFSESGVYKITPAGTDKGFDVYCDMKTDQGGWLVRCFYMYRTNSMYWDR